MYLLSVGNRQWPKRYGDRGCPAGRRPLSPTVDHGVAVPGGEEVGGVWVPQRLCWSASEQELGERDGSGQQCPIEVAGFVPAQQLFAVGVPGEAAFAVEEFGEDHTGLGRIAGGEPSQRFG